MVFLILEIKKITNKTIFLSPEKRKIVSYLNHVLESDVFNTVWQKKEFLIGWTTNRNKHRFQTLN